jgi:hypothetical protein
MSTIGSATVAGINMAGSVVGSSRSETSDRNKAASAEQKSQVDLQNFSESLSDVGNAEFGAERDADGRQLYRRSGRPTAGHATGSTANQPALTTPPVADAFGESGTTLDLEA